MKTAAAISLFLSLTFTNALARRTSPAATHTKRTTLFDTRGYAGIDQCELACNCYDVLPYLPYERTVMGMPHEEFEAHAMNEEREKRSADYATSYNRLDAEYECRHHCRAAEFACECFTEYKNRDYLRPMQPYAEISGCTLNECLSFCARDYDKCKGALFAYVGGEEREVCELYPQSGLPYHLDYYEGVNYYEPMRYGNCPYEVPPIRNGVVMQEPRYGRAEHRRSAKEAGVVQHLPYPQAPVAEAARKNYMRAPATQRRQHAMQSLRNNINVYSP